MTDIWNVGTYFICKQQRSKNVGCNDDTTSGYLVYCTKGAMKEALLRLCGETTSNSCSYHNDRPSPLCSMETFSR